MELLQEEQELLPIPSQDSLNLCWLVGIGHKDLHASLSICLLKRYTTHLEDMECLELDISALIPQKIHHHLQVRLVRNVSGHDAVVCPVQEDLAQQFKGLSLCDVVGGED